MDGKDIISISENSFISFQNQIFLISSFWIYEIMTILLEKLAHQQKKIKLLEFRSEF